MENLLPNQDYEALGYEKTVAGNPVGWARDPNDTTCDIDFDLPMEFVTRKNDDGSIERCWMINLNIDRKVSV